MYLIRLDMDRRVRAIRTALSDCQQMHRLIMGLFGTSRQDANVLYRINDQDLRISLYLYSDVPIMEDRLIPGIKLGGQRDIQNWVENLNDGQCHHFDLITVPAKKVAMEGKNSRRRILPTREERLLWLQRKAEQNGFSILEAEEVRALSYRGVHPGNAGKMQWMGYQYTGVLQIQDAKIFRMAMQKGIGSGKAYGLGMLLLM